MTHMIDTGHWYVDRSQSTSLHSGVGQGAGTETPFAQLKVQSNLYLQDTWDEYHQHITILFSYKKKSQGRKKYYSL